MVDQAVTWVDVEDAVRAWARDYVSSVSRRVFFGVNNDVAMPQVVLHRLGGPDSACLVQFDVWATTKAAAALVAAEVATEADALARYERAGTILHAAAPTSARWFPDPASDLPRYIVDVTFVATSTAIFSSG